MKKDKPHSTFFRKTYQSALISFPSVVLTFGVGHPFEVIQTRMQANPQIHSGLLLSKKIYQQTGIKGFYHGGFPNFVKMLLKASYRNPVRGAVSSKYSELFPNMDKTTIALLTGLTMPIMDVIFVPLERIKIWLITNPDSKGFFGFFKNRNQHGLPLHQDLFQGAKIAIANGMVKWSTYLVPEAWIRQLVMNYRPSTEKKDRQLSLTEQIVVGTLSGLINGLFAQPLDTIKTQIQQHGFTQSASLETMIKVAQTQVQKHGFLKGLYPACLPSLLHYVIVGVITSNLIQQVDEIWQPTVQMKMK